MKFVAPVENYFRPKKKRFNDHFKTTKEACDARNRIKFKKKRDTQNVLFSLNWQNKIETHSNIIIERDKK
jgi:hypothetical protein